MPITVEVVGTDKKIDRVINQAMDLLRQIDERYSTYRPSSEISHINAGELKISESSQQMQEVLATCDRLATETNGYFNIRFSGRIDPSGYVKGWAIQRAADLIQGAGFKDFAVTAGGDVQTGRNNTQGQPWRVGIRHPLQPNKLVKTVALSGGAIATSGTYERGQHIINPHTGKPAKEFLSLSVIGPSIARADVLATTAFAMGLDGMNWLTSQTGYEAYAITDSDMDKATLTSGFNHYLVG